jgi:periplasmic copper chaperone A
MKSAAALLLAFLSFAGVLGAGQDPKATDGRIVIPAAGATTTAAFAEIQNPGTYAIYLVSASSDAAGTIEFVDGAKSESVVKEVEVGAYETLAMTPGGIHLRVKDLTRTLRPGDAVSITFTTEQNVKVVVSAVAAEK